VELSISFEARFRVPGVPIDESDTYRRTGTSRAVQTSGQAYPLARIGASSAQHIDDR
jgi:hypothetical protein